MAQIIPSNSKRMGPERAYARTPKSRHRNPPILRDPPRPSPTTKSPYGYIIEKGINPLYFCVN